MTISILRALHGLIGEALDDIERVFNEQNAASPPELSSTVSEGSTPHSPKHIAPPLDFPLLDAPYDPNSPSERLVASSPVIRGAISRIVAACGQLSASTREPFLSLCDGSMGVSAMSLRVPRDLTIFLGCSIICHRACVCWKHPIPSKSFARLERMVCMSNKYQRRMALIQKNLVHYSSLLLCRCYVLIYWMNYSTYSASSIDTSLSARTAPRCVCE